MIRVGDKLRFSSKTMDEMYGGGAPVEVLGVNDRYVPLGFREAGTVVRVKVWEPFLYAGQEPHQIEQYFDMSWFCILGEEPHDSWFERLLDKVFG